MKKFIPAMLAIFTALSAASCLRVPESYFTPSPFYLSILAQSEDGTNLLDSTAVVNWVDSTVTLEYKGEAYTLDKKAERMDLNDMKYILYRFMDNSTMKYQYIACFGLFSGVADIDDDLFLRWPDNSTDTLHLVNKGTWSKNGKGFTSLTRTVTLNGDYVQTNVIIVKKEPGPVPQNP